MRGQGACGEGLRHGLMRGRPVAERGAGGEREDFDALGAGDLAAGHDDDVGLARLAQDEGRGVGRGDGVARGRRALGPAGELVHAFAFGEHHDAACGVGVADASREGAERHRGVVVRVDVDVRVDEDGHGVIAARAS